MFEWNHELTQLISSPVNTYDNVCTYKYNDFVQEDKDTKKCCKVVLE